MTKLRYPYRSALTAFQAPSPYDEEEIEVLRKRAWKEQTVLIIAPSDERLCDEERFAILEIGWRLYGKGGRS